MPEYVPQAILPPELDEMTADYLVCAEWSGIDDEQREAFENADTPSPHWSVESMERAVKACRDFDHDARWVIGGPWVRLHNEDPGQSGHDLWLTRNGHGTGFWDRYHGPMGETLTTLAEGYGERYVWFDAETSTLHLDG